MAKETKEAKEAAPVTKAKRELAILLEEIEIPFTGMRVTKTTTHLVTAGLIWPRTGIALKNGSLSAKLERGLASFGNENWGKKIILRENVEGRFALSLTVTEALNYEKLEKFLRECLRIAIKAGGDIADSLTGPAGDFVAAPFDAAAKMIGTYPGPKLLVQGMAELDASDFPESGGERRLTVQLNASQNFYATVRQTQRGKTSSVKRLKLREGAPDGSITLRVLSL